MGDKEHKAFQLTFNRFLKVDFQGSRVEAVSRAWAGLSPEDRARVGIFTTSIRQAGAMNLWGLNSASSRRAHTCRWPVQSPHHQAHPKGCAVNNRPFSGRASGDLQTCGTSRGIG